MKINYRKFVHLGFIVFAGILFFSCSNKIPEKYTELNKNPEIFPDYTNITIPANIAPLNFSINEESISYLVNFSNDKFSFNIKTNKGVVIIPVKKWKKLLNNTSELKIDIFGKTQTGDWVKYKSIINQLAPHSIDPYLVYREIDAGYILWDYMGIYQRNTESFKKEPIINNSQTNDNCMNCHTFNNHSPEKMLIHLRGNPGGTIFKNRDKISFIETNTDYTMAAGVYPSWHPGGNLVAFSVNRVRQRFHGSGNEQIYVFDQASDIVVYDINRNEITTTPKLATSSLENFPAWSHDGKHLYYISTNKYSNEIDPKEVKYDLLRIGFDDISGEWGQVDTLLKASETGKSISFPTPSPDGRFLMFCMANYGYFTVHRRSSDLYIMDLETLSYKEFPFNSSDVESFQSWSSNSRWLVFVSKQLDGLYSNPFFSYIDEDGNISKPFVLPEKHPDYFKLNAKNYNRPVLVKNKVKLNQNALKNAISNKIQAGFDKNVNIDALSGASKISTPEPEHDVIILDY
jgi:hypothetical protein